MFRVLVKGLKKKSIQAEYGFFPDRQTDIGKTINNYLKFEVSKTFVSFRLYFQHQIKYEKVSEYDFKLSKITSLKPSLFIDKNS